MNKKQKKTLKRIIISAVLLGILIGLDKIFEHYGIHLINEQIETYIWLALYLVPYIIIGYDILRKAALGIKNKQVFDECFLMAIATLGAIAIAIFNKSSDYVEAVAVMLFYQVGELFQSIAVGKSRKNITELMDIRPDYANLVTEDGTNQVDPDEVAIGSVILVSPGEKVPLDGIILEGNASVDTSSLTGESVPREVKTGDEIISGCINLSGVLKIQTTKEFGDSTVSKILDLVENASSKKSRSEAFISKFAHYYTPIVCYCALALAILPPLVSMVARLVTTGSIAAVTNFDYAKMSLESFLNFGMPMGAIWSQWIYRALTFLVISCPCALVISIPLSFFAGIGGASNAGVLVKGSNYLELLSKTDIVVMDKTGTLTKGVFEVTEIHPVGISEGDLLRAAAYAESFSNHPISRSLKAAFIKSTGEEIDKNLVSDIEEISGHGVTASFEGKKITAGNYKLMNKLAISYEEANAVGTLIYVAIDGNFAGYIVISDVIKETSAQAILSMKKVGISKTVMLTGDAKPVADKVGEMLGLDEVYSELLPQDKVDMVEKLIAAKRSDKDVLAFVGDGINDAPVLTRADIGIAMGALGSDAAIEAADIVLMDDDPLKISKAIKISRKCMRIVYENIAFALGIKLLCLVLGAFGIANMWYAIFADVGVMVIAVLNAIRALRVKKL